MTSLRVWPLKDVLLPGVCARINHPIIALPHLHCPHYCNTIARSLRNHTTVPRSSFVYAIHIQYW